MKEMVYMWPPMEPQNTILDRGYIGEFEYAIINRQMHPCSYVRLPEGSRLYKRLNGVKNAADMIDQSMGARPLGRNILRDKWMPGRG